MAKRGDDDYLTQRVRVRLDRWHNCGCPLGAPLQHAHAIYAALDIGTLERGLLERDVPRSLLYDTNGSNNARDDDVSDGSGINGDKCARV